MTEKEVINERQDIFRACAHYLRHERRRSEYFFCANEPNTSSLICRIPFVNRMALIHALVKVLIELIEIYFHSFEMLIVQIGEMSFYSKPEFIII
jgi:hypothetical protein